MISSTVLYSILCIAHFPFSQCDLAAAGKTVKIYCFSNIDGSRLWVFYPEIKTVIADSHYIYIFLFFSNLFILYYYYYFLVVFFLAPPYMVAWDCFGVSVSTQHFDDEQCLYVAHNLQTKIRFARVCGKEDEAKKKHHISKKKDHNADYWLELFLFHFDISIYLFSWAELFYFPLAVMSDIE